MARVHYAQSWEDPLLLWEIWQRTCPDHVHMVASGGDHALELLQKGLPSVALCDPESNQLGHVEAKLRALHHRDRNRLFGYGAHAKSQGLLHDGKLEGYLRLFSQRILPLMVSRQHREGLALQGDPQAQVTFLETHWNSWLWRQAIAYLFDPAQVDKNARHPGLVDTQGRTKLPTNYYAAFLRILGQTSLRENPYLDYVLYGRHAHSYLPYLEDAHFQPEGRLHLHHGALQPWLDTLPPAQRFIHASDILESYPEPALPKFFHSVDAACQTGSLLVFWDHRYATPVPEFFAKGWQRIPLTRIDRVPFYHSFNAYQKQ